MLVSGTKIRDCSGDSVTVGAYMFMAPIINTFSIAIEVIKIQVLSYSVTKRDATLVFYW